MASEFDKLVDAITELVLGELAAEQPSVPPPSVLGKGGGDGPNLLLVPGPGSISKEVWERLNSVDSVSFSVLTWDGFPVERLPSSARQLRSETRTMDWSKIASGYRGAVLFGADLGVLGGIAQLGAGGGPPAGLAVACLSSGLPVFVDNSPFETLRRHSSRLASGFVGRFEELYRTVASFGIDFGGVDELDRFLGQFTKTGLTAATPVGARSSGRDVVTVEDVEAVRRSGSGQIMVAIGSIVTPLAAQRASEWGIEVVMR